MNATAGTASAATVSERPSFPLRPGVMFPDWRFIRSAEAEAALLAIFRAVGIERRWVGYLPELDLVRTTILRSFAATGRGADADDLAAATGMSGEDVDDALRELARRDLVVLGGDRRATGAYPCTEAETGHSVARGDLSINAMCAIDALGAGAMLGDDVEIRSLCRACGSPVRASMAGKGERLASIAPSEAVVWVGEVYRDNCGTTSLCTTIAFFCSDSHLDGWRNEGRATGPGHRLTACQAHQVGAAIFGPSLRSPDPTT